MSVHHELFRLLIDLDPDLYDTFQNILDLGTGYGDWAVEVADKFPHCNISAHSPMYFCF